MSKIEGFNLIDLNEGVSYTTLNIEKGRVDHKPQLKYRYDEPNPMDPTDRFQVGKFHEDTFECVAYLTPEEYDELIDFIEDAYVNRQLRIEFTHGETSGGAAIIKQYIINVISSMPDSLDDGHEFRISHKFTFKSIYEELPELIGTAGVQAENIGYLT